MNLRGGVRAHEHPAVGHPLAGGNLDAPVIAFRPLVVDEHRLLERDALISHWILPVGQRCSGIIGGAEPAIGTRVASGHRDVVHVVGPLIVLHTIRVVLTRIDAGRPDGEVRN